MKDKLLKISFLFFLILTSFFFFPKTEKEQYYQVLQVIEADKFYIDLNNNQKADSNELFKLKNVNAFYPVKNEFSIELASKIDVPVSELLKAGLIAQKFANHTLLNKKIKIIDKTNDRISFEIDGYDYEQILLKNGLAIAKDDNSSLSYQQFQNFSQIKENAKKIKNDKVVFLDLNTNIIHNLNCDNLKTIDNLQLIFLKNIKNSNYLAYDKCKLHSLNANIEIPKSKKIYKNSLHLKDDFFQFFILNPLEFKKPNAKCETEVCKTLINQIKNSEKSIDAAIYGINDVEEIFNALLDAKSRGVKVRLVYQCDKNIGNVYPQNVLLADNFDSICNKKSNIMHNKFFIFDDKKLFTGSSNITSSGIGGYNSNISVLINDIDVAKIYKTEFNQMFQNKFSLRKSKLETFEKNINNTKIKVGFSPKGDVFNSIILPEMVNTKEEVFISAFYLTDDRIIEELIKLKKKNVRIFVILDSLSALNFKNKVAKLRNNGILVVTEDWGGKNHEKTILIDSKKLILGSSNFSKSGFNKNDENIVLFENHNIAGIYRDYFLYLINSINQKFLYGFVRAESLESRNSCFDGIDNNYDGKIDSDDDGCKKIVKKSN